MSLQLKQTDNSLKIGDKQKHKDLHSIDPTIKGSLVFTNLAENVLNTPLNQIGVNPFVSKLRFGIFDYIKVYIFGTIIFMTRIIPFVLIFFVSAMFAKLFWFLIWILDSLRIPSNKIKTTAKSIVFGFIRFAFFSVGFYWIKVTDKRGESRKTKATIIPIAPHSTFFDVILLVKLGIPAIVSRFENSKMCLVGSILRLCEPVYVQRDDKNSRMKAADDIKARAMIGNIMIFPEGTCTNRLALIQFKMGAFLPQLPVQPVVIKWGVDSEKHDLLSWTFEGPGLLRLLFYTLGRLYSNCEIVKLPVYVPNEEEKSNARHFADNVAKVMCDELGVLQSFYSYDDTMFMGFANEIRIFRSPVCIKLLKLCYKIASENLKSTQSNALSQKIKLPKLAIFSPKYHGFGEDFEHISNVPDFYIPKTLKRIQFGKKKKNLNKKSEELNSNDFKRLPLSGVMRKNFEAFRTIPQIALTSELANAKRVVYETFCGIVEKSINEIEEKAELRPIESTEDLAKLLGLEHFANINLIKSSLVDLLKALEFMAIDGPTTLHLLIALHLCDCREPDLWGRIRACMVLLSAVRNQNYGNKDSDLKSNKIRSNTSLNLMQFKLLLWYSLGLQEFNDRFFVQHDFDFDFVKKNLKRLFSRAVDENARCLD